VSVINLIAELNDYLLLTENACRCGTICSKLLTCQIIFHVDTCEMNYRIRYNAETFMSLFVQVRLVDVILSYTFPAGVDFER
jgi:hypothetical protein